MNSRDAFYLSQAVRSAQRTYHQTGDGVGYIADLIFLAAKMGATELGAANPSLRHLSTGLTVASPAFKAAIEEIIHVFQCPIDAEHTHDDFLRHVAQNARRYIDRDWAVVGRIMSHMGI